jgi:hypothetical protein
MNNAKAQYALVTQVLIDSAGLLTILDEELTRGKDRRRRR